MCTDFLELSIGGRDAGTVWAKLSSAGILIRGSVWRMLLLGELDDLLLQHNNVRARSAEL